MAGFGAFGKMPSAGDFFRLNTPVGFVRVWDNWLQQVMLAGQGAYGRDFDGHYMSAPIWRFTLPAGQAGAAKVMGVMMPSVDRVGRRFPLTLMAPLATPGPAALDHLSDAAVFARLEDVALDALEDTMTRDKLSEVLADISVPDMRAVAPLPAANARLVRMGPTGAELLSPALAGEPLEARLKGCSLWTAILDGVPRMMACPGLPQGEAAMRLFDLSASSWSEGQPL